MKKTKKRGPHTPPKRPTPATLSSLTATELLSLLDTTRKRTDTHAHHAALQFTLFLIGSREDLFPEEEANAIRARHAELHQLQITSAATPAEIEELTALQSRIRAAIHEEDTRREQSH